MADSNAKKLAQLLDGNGDVLLDNLDNISVDATSVSDSDNTSTGQFTLPSGTTAQRPGTPYSGAQRYNTDLGVMEYYNGTNWFKISAQLAALDSVSGIIYAGLETTLTLSGSGFLTDTLTVNFNQSSDGINVDVDVTASSDTSATVTVPSSVYSNVTAGNAVTIKVTNTDGSQSSGVDKTAVALPSGGTLTTSGNYRIHTFTSSGTFTNTVSNLEVEYLVIAGGGGGGSDYGGGGGAGGYRCSVSGETSGRGTSAESSLTLSTGNKTVTVGAGGSGATLSESEGNQGSNSVFDTITSIGGGYGSGENNKLPGGNGGSGGGTNYGNPPGGSGGSGTSGQGYDGGDGVSGPSYSQGGGGGAGSAGANATPSSNGNGGNGLASSITGSSITRAGGGGGGYSSDQNIAGASGGSGGGGNGGASNNGSGQNGDTNKGSGGGGAGGSASSAVGGNGGSGIVIVRYDVTTI